MKIWARWRLHTSVGCISLQNAQQGPHFVTQPILLSENIPIIWHKSSTKHKEVRPDWNDKNDNANYALVSHGIYQWLRFAILKNIRSSAKRFRLWRLFYSELKRHNVTLYL